MVDWLGAFRKPFKDISTLIIGIVLITIPIVNIPMLGGYPVRVINRTVQRDNNLPKITENFGRLVVDSIKIMAIGIVYIIPAIVISAILFWVLGGDKLLRSFPLAAVQNPIAMAEAFGSVALATIVAVIVYLVFSLLAYSAVIEFAKSGRLGSAFSIGRVIGSALNGSFIITYILMFIFSSVVMLIPIVNFIAAFPLTVIMATVLAQAHEGI